MNKSDDLLTRISKWLMPSMWRADTKDSEQAIEGADWPALADVRPELADMDAYMKTVSPRQTPSSKSRSQNYRGSRRGKSGGCGLGTAIVAATIVSDSSSGGGDW